MAAVHNLRAEAVINDANLNGVKLIVDGDTLIAEPEDRHFGTTPLLLAKLKKHRAEIIETLTRDGRHASDIESVRASFARQAGMHAEREAMRLSNNEKMPDVYFTAWATLTDRTPQCITNEVWEQAVDDGSVFLGQYGKRAESFGWSVADIFNVPRVNGTAGILWFLKGRRVSSLFRDHASIEDGSQSYCRISHRELGPGK
jgi:hypothetical protein